MGQSNPNEQLIDGKYRTFKRIGAGGMGVVYAATSIQTGQEVAVKLLNSWHDNDSRTAKQLQREARLVATLDHPNICPVFDHGMTEDGAPYMVMPLLKGCSLAERLGGQNQLTLLEALDITIQILDALEAAHDRDIVHRDLKPENIYVESGDGSPNRVKLLDFGISKILKKDISTQLTATGGVLGTAYYFAPELARGKKQIDHRVDIYAMGVILYQILTDRFPFEGDSHEEILYKIGTTPFQNPRVLNSEIPPALEEIVLKAMSFEIDDRFHSVAEMRDAVIAAVEVLDNGSLGTLFPPLLVDLSGEIAAATKTYTLTQPNDEARAPLRRWIVFPLLTILSIVIMLIWRWISSPSMPSSEEALNSAEYHAAKQNRKEHTKSLQSDAKISPSEQTTDSFIALPQAMMDTDTSENKDRPSQPPSKLQKTPIKGRNAARICNSDGSCIPDLTGDNS